MWWDRVPGYENLHFFLIILVVHRVKRIHELQWMWCITLIIWICFSWFDGCTCTNYLTRELSRIWNPPPPTHTVVRGGFSARQCLSRFFEGSKTSSRKLLKLLNHIPNNMEMCKWYFAGSYEIKNGRHWSASIFLLEQKIFVTTMWRCADEIKMANNNGFQFFCWRYISNLWRGCYGASSLLFILVFTLDTF